MSTRWYPLYQKGNPQLRVFLPNFWLKLVKPSKTQPSNIVEFHCSMEMTKYDIQNYLEKIYNVYPVDVRTRIALGKTRQSRALQCIVKDEDVKIAYVILPKDQSFTFPNIFPEEKLKNADNRLQEAKKEYAKFTKLSTIPGASSWFRVH